MNILTMKWLLKFNVLIYGEAMKQKKTRWRYEMFMYVHAGDKSAEILSNFNKTLGGTVDDRSTHFQKTIS